MATHANPVTTRSAHPRQRRWWAVGTIIVLSLGIYAVSLSWAVGHVETGVENSIRLAPAVVRSNDADSPIPAVAAPDSSDGLK